MSREGKREEDVFFSLVAFFFFFRAGLLILQTSLLKSKMGLIIADFGEKREEGIWSLHPSG